jgi:hypothetical protein
LAICIAGPREFHDLDVQFVEAPIPRIKWATVYFRQLYTVYLVGSKRLEPVLPECRQNGLAPSCSESSAVQSHMLRTDIEDLPILSSRDEQST